MSLARDQIMQKFLSSVIGANGLLNATQAKTFTDELVEETELLKLCDRRMTNEKAGDFFKINLGSPVTVAASEGTEYLDETGEPTTSKYSYSVKKARTQFEFTSEDDVWTIEGPAFKEHVVRLWEQRMALDMENLAISGDESLYATPSSAWEKLIDINDGWLHALTTANGVHILDAANVTIGGASAAYPSHSLFAAAYGLVPTKYLKFARQNYRWITSPHVIQDYLHWLASRQTSLGDAILQGRAELTPERIPFLDVSAFPEDLGENDDQCVVVLADPKAFVWMVHREMKLLNRYVQEKDSYRYTGYTYSDFIVTNYSSIVKVVNVERNTDFAVEEES